MHLPLDKERSVVGFVPKEMFFTKGVGKHREKLTSFELALRSAGIAACNLVRVSSIFPPNCRILSRAEGMKRLEPGQVTFVVMSEAATREPHRLIAATVGVAIPRDRDLYGYLSEHHSFGESEDVAGDYAEELAAEMLATTLGLEFDPDKSWDEKKEVYRLSNEIVRTQNVTQTAVGDKKGLWTTVVAAAVLVGLIAGPSQPSDNSTTQRTQRTLRLRPIWVEPLWPCCHPCSSRGRLRPTRNPPIPSVFVLKGWGAHSRRSRTMPQRPGGTRQVSPPGPSST